MQGANRVDPGMSIDWGKTSLDYAKYRPGPPPSFYEKLKAYGIGTSGQSILDLATGTGVLARQFAKQGCEVVGSDISAEQIKMAGTLAKLDHLEITSRSHRQRKFTLTNSLMPLRQTNVFYISIKQKRFH
jgi:2-polyprenyl-3-methyl-5-hydroxy-6-metoxy-1,4-benzoquinol methylase